MTIRSPREVGPISFVLPKSTRVGHWRPPPAGLAPQTGTPVSAPGDNAKMLLHNLNIHPTVLFVNRSSKQ